VLFRSRAPVGSAEQTLWERRTQLESANKQYQAAAKLFDSGRKEEALQKLDQLLKQHSDYPLGLMLRQLARSP